MTANERLMDEAITLARILDRLAQHSYQVAAERLAQLREDLSVLVIRYDPTSLRYAENQRTRLAALIEEAQDVISRTYVGIAERVDQDLLQAETLAQDSLSTLMAALLIVKGLSRRLDDEALAAARDGTLIDGVTARGWLAKQSGDLQFRTGGALRDALSVHRLTRVPVLNDLLNAIRSDASGSLFSAPPRHIESLIISAHHAVANSVRHETIIRHPELFRAIQQLSALDSRTTTLCRSRSNKLWTLGGDGIGHRLPFITPPLHWNSVAKGSLITTDQGPVPIENVTAGMSVLTHRGRYRRVSAVMSKPCESMIIKIIRTESGRELRATDEHPALTHAAGWKRVGEIEIGDKLFEDLEEFERGKVLSAVVGVADNYPSPFQQTEVFSSIRCSPGIVPSPVYFQNDLGLYEGEVPHCSINDELWFERDSRPAKRFQEWLLAWRGGRLAFPSNRVVDFVSDLFGHTGVVSTHPPTGPSVVGIGILGFPPSPVVCSSLVIGGIGHMQAASSYPAPNCNSMPFAPEAQRCFTQPEGSLKLPDGLLPFEVMDVDECLNSVLVSEIQRSHWRLSSVVAIDEQFYPSTVYNIEVEEDNTYVANGIIVHNCRSHIVPVMHPYDDLAPRIQRRVKREDYTGAAVREPDLSGWLKERSLERDEGAIDYSGARSLLGL